jgi:outer membrane receptor for ferrienterochelin and colicins
MRRQPVRLLSAAIVLLTIPATVSAQEAAARLTVCVSAEGKPAAGAEVRDAGDVAMTNVDGRATLRLAPGVERAVVWKMGFSVDTLMLRLRPGTDTTVVVQLAPVAQELAPIVVQATRVETRIEEEPERVEVLAPEDVGEKSLTHPGDMTNLLVEMGGLHIQPISPGLGGVNLRMQGLPGRFTYVLSDGLPLYGAQAPSFSLAQMPPLDLRQVEVLKGATTALYGPSALGGVVDLISRAPAHTRQLLLSQTTRDGTDGLLWLSDRLTDQWGYTLLAGAHGQGREDPDRDGWTDIPGYTRGEARPRVYWTGKDGSSLMLTAGGIWEDRKGGTLPGAVVPSGTPFGEALDTRHLDAGAIGHLILSPDAFLGLRASAMETRHDRSFGGDIERDLRRSVFAEGTVSLTRGRHEAVLGLSAQYDGFRHAERPGFDYDFTDASVFGEETYTPVAAVSLEASARLDHHDRYGTFLSPRVSALWRLAGDWSVRASAGSGFSAPTPLVPEVEDAGLSRLQPLGPLRVERGRSASVDVGGSLGPFQINGTLFGVRVADPVLPKLLPGDSGRFALMNAPGPIRTEGAEVFAVYARDPFLVTATYSQTDATEFSLEEGRRITLPLTPRNAGGVDIAYEEDEPGESGIRVALEVFYTGPQRVEEDPYRTFTPGYTTAEILISKRLGRFLLFGNGENLTNVRQTDWDPLLLPAPGIGGRWTTEEWAPLEGRVVNVGVRATL